MPLSIKTLQPLAQPSLRRLACTLVAVNLVVVAALAGVTALALHKSRNTDEARARDAADNMASGLAAEVAGEIRQIDNALATICLVFKRQGVDTPAGREAVEQVIADQRSLLTLVDTVRATDPQGLVTLGLGAGDKPGVSVGDRDYFKTALATEGMVISEPLQGRIRPGWGLILARRLVAADGKVAGVVYTNLSSQRLADGFKRLSLGSGGAIALRSPTQRLIARHAVGDSTPQRGLGTDTISAELARGLAANPSQGWYVTHTVLDGVERVSSYRRLPHYGLLVLAGLSTEDYLVAWRAEARHLTALMSTVVLTIAGFSLLLFQRARKERAAQVRITRLAREQHVMLDNDLVAMVRMRNRIVIWKNRALDTLFGYQGDELLNSPARQLYLDDASHLRVGNEGYAALQSGRHYRTQLQMRRKDGSAVWIDLCGAAISPEESLWMMTDITAIKDSEAHARHLALHDGLTGLPNRVLFDERLAYILASAQRSGSMTAVCFVDLDGFKAVNDRYGHAAGDAMLREVAARLAACVRNDDVVARLGGDEFALVLSNLHGPAEAAQVLDRVLVCLGEPVALSGGGKGTVGASIGVALSPLNGIDPDELMRCADEAMYESKRDGKHRITYFQRELLATSPSVAAGPRRADVTQ